jgi:Fic family protein
MQKITQNQENILAIFLEKGSRSSSVVHEELVKQGHDVSLVTVKRELSELKSIGLLDTSGAGRSVEYTISSQGRLLNRVDAKSYCSIDPDGRYGLKGYNFDLFTSIPQNVFFEHEISILDAATDLYHSNITSQSPVLQEKELERFVIELSWKSSKIEGNTYTLLDTERLLNQGIEASGHDKDEARMILNHKEAFKFAREHLALFKDLTPANIEEMHKIIVKDLGIDHGFREKCVGVTGSIYQPLDNVHQIREAVASLCAVVNRLESHYMKALVALLGIGYIQPFEDGNKRTSRLIANAILLAYSCTPLSYRSVDDNEYREAVFVFYELNSIQSFKKIFIEQYDFAAKNYAVK